MDSLVEENGNTALDPLGDNGQHNESSNCQNSGTVLTSGANIVQFIPTSSIQTQSVIQPNQSVIQTATATNLHPVTLQKGVLYVNNKPNTVIHTTTGNTVQIQIKPEPNQHQMLDTNSDESLSDDDSPRRLREITRRPSYHKIFKDISGPDMAGQLPLQISDSSGGISAIAPAGTGTIICQDTSSYYIPNNNTAEDQTRKREIRLLKNREAARECRRKKKEYIKCLENRVAVLENQNKALIDELKSLKELYCQTQND